MVDKGREVQDTPVGVLLDTMAFLMQLMILTFGGYSRPTFEGRHSLKECARVRNRSGYFLAIHRTRLMDTYC